MTHEEYRKAAENVVYLAACAVNGETPDAERVAGMDLEALYLAAERHLLTGIAAMALERAGVRDEAFTQAKGKAIRKVVTLDVERTAVLAALEEAGIWHMPLKGSILKDLYPQLGMRQMSDNDILYDASRASDVRSIMEELGFEADRYPGHSVHDHYVKPPVCNFEMHRALFGELHDERLYAYYRDVKGRLIRDENSSYGFHFSDEDFYVYMIAHEYKHFSGSGTGLRSLLDTYVYWKEKGNALDWPYVSEELEKLGLTEFEAQNRSLALHLFRGEELTTEEAEMLEYVLSSGTYGTADNRARKLIQKKGRLGYVFTRAFPHLRVMRVLYPVLRPLPFLLPICWALRWVRALFEKPKKVMIQLKAVFKR